MDINRLSTFCILYQCKGFQEASRKHNLNPSSIRKKILALEAELGVSLIETASGQRIIFTNAAHKFYHEALQIVDFTNSKISHFVKKQNEFDDKIVIATTHAVASLWLPNLIPKFNMLFPEVQLIVKSSDEKFNLYQREADVSVVSRDVSDSHIDDYMVQLPLNLHYMNLYASERYIEKFGNPNSIDDLKNHNIISFGQNIPYPYDSINWHLKYLPEDYEPKIEVNSGVAILKLVQSGCGIGSVSQKGCAASDPRLIRILPNHLSGPTINVTYNYPKTREGEGLIMQLYQLLKDCL